VKCPECDAALDVPGDAMAGELVTCPDCGADYEVSKAGPEPELKRAEKVGEDWGE